MTTIKVKPAPDIKVINPETGRPLLQDGEIVTTSKYWTRRIEEAAVVVVEDKKPATK